MLERRTGPLSKCDERGRSAGLVVWGHKTDGVVSSSIETIYAVDNLISRETQRGWDLPPLPMRVFAVTKMSCFHGEGELDYNMIQNIPDN